MSNATWPVIEPDIYGPIVGAPDVRDNVKATIDLWSPAYIAVVAARTGQALVPFVAYSSLYSRRALTTQPNEATYWVTTEPGTTKVERRGTKWFGTWRVEVQVVVFGTDWDATEDLAHYYGLAVRALLLQHGSLGLVTGTAVGALTQAVGINTAWVRERYQMVDDQSRRTIGVHQDQYDVTVEGVIDQSAGPRTPPVPPAPFPVPGTSGNPTVTAVDVTVTKTGVDG